MSYHFAVSIVAYLNFGASIVLPSNHFAPAVAAALARHPISLIYGSPAHYLWLIDHTSSARLTDVRLAVSTTTTLDRQFAERFQATFGIPLTQALGIIEIGLPCINTEFAAEHPEAVGRVLPAYNLRLEDVGLGSGYKEVLFSGKGFLDAYYHPWQTRASIMPDGWFRTGDAGEVDVNGCLFIRGRIKDVINVLGMKFFPQEVEAVLQAHPRVAAACVLPARHPRLGEVARALVVVRGGAPTADLEAELLAACRQRLAAFKIPQHIEFVDALPRTGSGKVLHREPAETLPSLANPDGQEVAK
jgi:long-chain acyl-CoA synthetase